MCCMWRHLSQSMGRNCLTSMSRHFIASHPLNKDEKIAARLWDMKSRTSSESICTFNSFPTMWCSLTKLTWDVHSNSWKGQEKEINIASSVSLFHIRSPIHSSISFPECVPKHYRLMACPAVQGFLSWKMSSWFFFLGGGEGDFQTW